MDIYAFYRKAVRAAVPLRHWVDWYRSANADFENGMVEQIVRLSELVRIARDLTREA